ncbi:MAG: hypothetical protein H3C36_14645 [Chitinophagaceae bacterium]|nr:hypothetical protein [Chitinophagaceae bacterium]
MKDGKYCDQTDNRILTCVMYEKGVLRKVYTLNAKDTTISHGPILEFSSTGDTLVKGYYKNNVLIGSYYEYFRENHPKKYTCFDSFNEDTLFYREYSMDGKILREKGEVLYGEGYTGYNTEKLQADSTLEILSVLITPPKSTTLVYSYLVRPGGLNADTIHPVDGYYEPNQNNLIYTNKFKIRNGGDYRVITITEFHDSSMDRTLRKTEHYDFSF